MAKVDLYAVVGHPIAHSRSPEIHRLFAQATHQAISYERLEGPLDGFEEFALGLRDSGYLGLNVTIPFKLDASKMADTLTARARLAGAVNTLKFDGDTIYGDNTDGVGFVRDITHRHQIAVANRTHGRAQELADEFGVEAIRLDEIPAEHFDLIVNGTSSSLNHDAPAIDPETFVGCDLAYDLVYAPEPTPFMRLAERGGARAVADGLGMLIEQAAESFLFWRDVRPDTAPVYHELRRLLDQSRTSP